MTALHRTEWRAVGTTCAAAVTAGQEDEREVAWALAAAQEEVAACERELSRFDPTSDLSRLNDADGRWVYVGSRLLEALCLALRAREETGGRFDPTVLPGTRGRRLRPLVRAARGAAGRGSEWLAGGDGDRARRTARPRAARGRLRRRSRRYRQGVCRRARPGRDARCRTDRRRRPRRSRRRHRRLGRVAGGRPLADRRGRSAPSGRDACGPCPRGRRSRDVGAQCPSLRPCSVAPPSDRPGDRRVRARRSVDRHRRRARPRRGRGQCDDTRDRRPGEAAAYVAARPHLSALYVPHAGPAIPLGRLPLVTERLVVRVAA